MSRVLKLAQLGDEDNKESDSKNDDDTDIFTTNLSTRVAVLANNKKRISWKCFINHIRLIKKIVIFKVKNTMDSRR